MSQQLVILVTRVTPVVILVPRVTPVVILVTRVTPVVILVTRVTPVVILVTRVTPVVILVTRVTPVVILVTRVTAAGNSQGSTGGQRGECRGRGTTLAGVSAAFTPQLQQALAQLLTEMHYQSQKTIDH